MNSSSLSFIPFLVLLVVYIAAFWKVFVKAGKPGWAAIIPIYNIFILLQIVGRPIWWIVLFLIPIVNIIISLIISMDLAKAFGKSQVFGIVGLWLFSFIGYLILGFGSAKYVGVAAAPANPSVPQQPQVVPPSAPVAPPVPPTIPPTSSATS